MTFYNELDLKYAKWELEQIKKTCAEGADIDRRHCRKQIMHAQFRVEHIAHRLQAQPQQAKRLNNLWHTKADRDVQGLSDLLETN